MLAVTATFYLARLDYSPVYLLNDEVFNALQAQSLAATGRSIQGDRWPVYFRGLEFPPGRDPLCVYATALSLKLLPPGEVALRAPTAMLALVSIIVTYLIGVRLWRDWRLGAMTAAILATTPAFYINSRIAIPSSWSLPWLLSWFLLLIIYAEHRRTRVLAASLACLAMAIYGYFGTALLVPLLVAETAVLLSVSLRVRGKTVYVTAAIGLLLPLVFVVYWHTIHPERWRELADYYLTAGSAMRRGTPLLGAGGGLNFAGLHERISTYWNYFNPSFLFLSGDQSPRYSTGRSGVFLLPAVVLLPLGMYRAAQSPGIGRLLVATFFVSPLAGAFANDVQIQRALPLVIFGALLCAWGAVTLITPSWRRHRFVLACLLAISVTQCVFFTWDYYGGYRVRSGASRGGNLRGAIVRTIETARQHAVSELYLDRRVDNIAYYWRLYTEFAGARDLTGRATIVAPRELPASAPAGSLLIHGPQEGLPSPDAALADWRLLERIIEVDEVSFYSIWQKGVDDASAPTR
jgi:4-amino-4-deoxy-L-arabinose transferase-like glycosyltransferase